MLKYNIMYSYVVDLRFYMEEQIYYLRFERPVSKRDCVLAARLTCGLHCTWTPCIITLYIAKLLP
jgi:hypothetical protein